MKARPMTESDIPAVKEIVETSGHEYIWPRPDTIEAQYVVVDSQGTILMAACASRTIELSMACDNRNHLHPMVKMHCVAILHRSMRDALLPKGYTEAAAFMSPKTEKSFARHLQRHFGWLKTWTAYVIRFGKVD